jgi:hypothetical protein
MCVVISDVIWGRRFASASPSPRKFFRGRPVSTLNRSNARDARSLEFQTNGQLPRRLDGWHLRREESVSEKDAVFLSSSALLIFRGRKDLAQTKSCSKLMLQQKWSFRQSQIPSVAPIL